MSHADLKDRAFLYPFGYQTIVNPGSSIELLARWNAELTGFYARRLHHYWSLPAKFAACRSADDAIAVQSDFYGQLVADYRAEAVALAAIAAPESARPDADYAGQLLKAQEDAKEIVRQAKVQAERILAGAKESSAESSAKTDSRRASAA